jgi:dUTP pyrophosphatase
MLSNDTSISIRVKKLVSDAVLPSFKSALASGADLCASESGTVAPGQVRLVSTGISVAIPKGYEIQIRSRSGLAAKSSVWVLNSPGTVDADYRGELKIILANFGHGLFSFMKGDRLAQMVCVALPSVRYDEVDELDGTERGSAGFGSTGLQS